MGYVTKTRMKQGRTNKFEQRFRQKQGNRFLGGNKDTSGKGRFNKKFKVKKVLTSAIFGGAALMAAKKTSADSGGGGVGHPTRDVIAAKKHYATMQTKVESKQSKQDAMLGAGILLAVASLCFGLAAVHRHNRLERAKKRELDCNDII